jgi:tripartite-type tricarboxylate transporter receptor subunit TctC
MRFAGGMTTIRMPHALPLLAIGAFIPGAQPVSAQSYPNKPVRVICAGVGGGADVSARLLAPGLSEGLGQQIVIDNRPSGVIPGEIAAKAAPDGYTLLLYNNTVWVGPLIQRASYDAVRDFAPITLTNQAPNILVVHSALPVKTVKQLIALAKARPGQLNYATGSTGASNHIAAELFKSMAGVDMVRIPYKTGSQESAALISGEVQLMFASASMTPYVRSGRLRALAVTSPSPSPLFPGLPTIASAGLPGYESGSIYALFAPIGTPAAIISRVNRDSARVLHTPEIKERFFRAGMEAVGSSPEELGATIKSDIARVSKLIKDAGIRE